MEVRNGVSAIIYDKRGSIIHFLIIHRNRNWKGWEFPKGKVEQHESAKMALIREIREEAGLKKFEIKARLVKKREFNNEGVLYSFETFLVEANMNVPVIIDKEEHDNYVWTTKDGVIDKLYWPDEKAQFVEALAILETANL